MLNVLLIVDKNFPSNHPFLEEVYTKSNDYFKTIFLMTTKRRFSSTLYWNKAKVYLISRDIHNPLNRFFITYFCDIRYTWKIIKILYKENISIVQIRNITYPLLICLILKKIFKIKVIYQKSHPHEIRILEKNFCDKFRFPKLKYYSNLINVFLLHKILKYCDAILPISEKMKENLYRTYNIPKHKMFPMGMGISAKYIQKIEFTPINNPKTNLLLIYIGTMRPERRLEILLKSIKIAITTAKDKYKIHLTLVGGNQNDIDYLKKEAIHLKIMNHIKFIGFIDRYSVYKILATHHIGISYIPDDIRFYDSSPTKLMEYLSVGLPVIGTNCVIQQKEIIHDTRAGILTDDNANHLAKAILKLRKNYDVYRRNAQKARKMIINNHSYENMREQIFHIYNQI